LKVLIRPSGTFSKGEGLWMEFLGTAKVIAIHVPCKEDL